MELLTHLGLKLFIVWLIYNVIIFLIIRFNKEKWNIFKALIGGFKLRMDTKFKKYEKDGGKEQEWFTLLD